MTINSLRIALLLIAACIRPAWAADWPASFPEAAKLHRAGDTAAAMAIWLPRAATAIRSWLTCAVAPA
ncbi:MAG: hypothetical protein IPK39_07530 [Sulfuritalea sp.]|nr:hypothetical protein [Sulfuritalea sp.]